MKKRLFIMWITLLISSCSAQNLYLKKINIHEIALIKDYIINNRLFEKKDSINQKTNSIYLANRVCLYKEDVKNKLIQEYIVKYDFDRICLENRNDIYFNKVIVFHKSYNPIFGKSIVIQYDFGESPLRDRIKQGIKNENGYYSVIIDDLYIYSVNNKPSFGE